MGLASILFSKIKVKQGNLAVTSRQQLAIKESNQKQKSIKNRNFTSNAKKYFNVYHFTSRERGNS